MSEETKPKEIPRDKKVNFLSIKFMHYAYSSQFKSQIVARSFIDSLVTPTFRLRHPGIKEVRHPKEEEMAYPLCKVPIKPAKIKDTEIDAVYPH
ncbi:hypothetical protein WA026_019663 [Henosepilachna vigintioctopunctata]|uniref:Uncharacterized protein n=1 Tax=Henosepilachna vigintioctopunctata TaxID=420089 RepID=A0AAW1UMW4_9CUCU